MNHFIHVDGAYNSAQRVANSNLALETFWNFPPQIFSIRGWLTPWQNVWQNPQIEKC